MLTALIVILNLAFFPILFVAEEYSAVEEGEVIWTISEVPPVGTGWVGCALFGKLVVVVVRIVLPVKVL